MDSSQQIIAPRLNKTIAVMNDEAILESDPLDVEFGYTSDPPHSDKGPVGPLAPT